MTDKVLDVAIIGAGIAGAYAGWRLVTQRNNCQVVIFEASGRVGGRLYSVTPPGRPDVKVELGGHRILTAKEQPRINYLIQMLNEDAPPDQQIATYALPDETPPENVMYLRGSHLRREEASRDPGCQGAKCIPFQVAFTEKGQSPDSILLNALEQIVPGITDPSLSPSRRRAMTRDAVFEGTPLHALGFEPLLRRVLSHEAYRFVMQAGTYESVIIQGNAADVVAAFPAAIRATKEAWGFKKGFQQVPCVLAERFKQCGGEIRFNMSLEGFEWKDGVAELHFRGHPTVRARAVVLALPRSALEGLAATSPLLREEVVRKLLAGAEHQPAARLYTEYPDRWWTAAGVEKGSTVSDLPVGKSTYWVSSKGNSLDEKVVYEPIVRQVIHNKKVLYWDSEDRVEEVAVERGAGGRGEAQRLPRSERFVGFRESLGQGAEVDPEWLKNAPSQQLVENARQQLAETHNLKHIPKVGEAAYKSWATEGLGFWRAGVRSDEAAEAMLQPIDDVPVHFVNADFARTPVSAEGALEAVESMLKKSFDIRPLVADEER